MKRRLPATDRDSRHDPSGMSDADRELFAQAMADVVPLPAQERERVRPVADIIDGPHAAVRPDVPADEESAASSYAASGVDRRVLRRLRRQEMAVSARLDVHGLTAAQALAEVERFIDGSRHRRRACVCIVHGRGLHSEGQVAVLKVKIRDRLRNHRQVLAYTDAPASDGGAGAVYVLLRTA